MAVLVYLAILMLTSHLEFASAALRVWGIQATGLGNDAGEELPDALPDPYVWVWYGSSFVGKTEILTDNANPSWTEEFSLPDANVGEILKLEMYDQDVVNDDFLAICANRVEIGSHQITCQLTTGTLIYNYEAV